MDDAALIVIVLVVAIAGVAGIAYLLERRRKAFGAMGPELPELGPVGTALLWTIRGLVAIMVFSIMGVFAFRTTDLAWVAAGCLVIYIIVRWLFRIIRASGK